MKFRNLLGALAVTGALLFTANGCGDDSSTVTPDGYGQFTESITDAQNVVITDISNL